MTNRLARGALIGVATIVVGCDDTVTDPAEVCTGWSDWSTSSYILPYSSPNAYTVIQGQCSPVGNGHRGVNRYSYDFGMPINTRFVAARSGTVASVEESHFDGQVGASGLDNYIVVLHVDGTAALYGHLTNNGSVVGVGVAVTQGQLLGFSGNTGNTGNVAHLHFSAHSCNPVTGGSESCPTIPTNFRNTSPNPQGLQLGVTYTAE
jgi:murein DD-endopeptidase MepM/ murein hydrolase activator NlpD